MSLADLLEALTSASRRLRVHLVAQDSMPTCCWVERTLCGRALPREPNDSDELGGSIAADQLVARANIEYVNDSLTVECSIRRAWRHHRQAQTRRLSSLHQSPLSFHPLGDNTTSDT